MPHQHLISFRNLSFCQRHTWGEIAIKSLSEKNDPSWLCWSIPSLPIARKEGWDVNCWQEQVWKQWTVVLKPSSCFRKLTNCLDNCNHSLNSQSFQRTLLVVSIFFLSLLEVTGLCLLCQRNQRMLHLADLEVRKAHSIVFSKSEWLGSVVSLERPTFPSHCLF